MGKRKVQKKQNNNAKVNVVVAAAAAVNGGVDAEDHKQQVHYLKTLNNILLNGTVERRKQVESLKSQLSDASAMLELQSNLAALTVSAQMGQIIEGLELKMMESDQIVEEIENQKKKMMAEMEKTIQEVAMELSRERDFSTRLCGERDQMEEKLVEVEDKLVQMEDDLDETEENLVQVEQEVLKLDVQRKVLVEENAVRGRKIEVLTRELSRVCSERDELKAELEAQVVIIGIGGDGSFVRGAAAATTGVGVAAAETPVVDEEKNEEREVIVGSGESAEKEFATHLCNVFHSQVLEKNILLLKLVETEEKLSREKELSARVCGERDELRVVLEAEMEEKQLLSVKLLEMEDQLVQIQKEVLRLNLERKGLLEDKEEKGRQIELVTGEKSLIEEVNREKFGEIGVLNKSASGAAAAKLSRESYKHVLSPKLVKMDAKLEQKGLLVAIAEDKGEEEIDPKVEEMCEEKLLEDLTARNNSFWVFVSSAAIILAAAAFACVVSGK